MTNSQIKYAGAEDGVAALRSALEHALPFVKKHGGDTEYRKCLKALETTGNLPLDAPGAGALDDAALRATRKIVSLVRGYSNVQMAPVIAIDIEHNVPAIIYEEFAKDRIPSTTDYVPASVVELREIVKQSVLAIYNGEVESTVDEAIEHCLHALSNRGILPPPTSTDEVAEGESNVPAPDWMVTAAPDKYRDAISKHREAVRNDPCHEHDSELWTVLGDGDTAWPQVGESPAERVRGCLHYLETHEVRAACAASCGPVADWMAEAAQALYDSRNTDWKNPVAAIKATIAHYAPAPCSDEEIAHVRNWLLNFANDDIYLNSDDAGVKSDIKNICRRVAEIIAQQYRDHQAVLEYFKVFDEWLQAQGRLLDIANANVAALTRNEALPHQREEIAEIQERSRALGIRVDALRLGLNLGDRK